MTVEPDVFATSVDLEQRWHKLTDEEREKADTHLADVTDYIKERSPNWRRLLDERPRLLTKITCDIVRRIMQADPYDIPGGITQMNQTTGSFIEIWRGQPTTDTDGNPIQGKPARVGAFQALVAPTSTIDQVEENASPRTIEYTIHIRGSQPSGIQATDLIKVRGILLPVKGKPQVWNNLHGRHIGDVITVGEREG